ncbi:DUF4129 domain-containing protein [Ancylothrix sp. C2]|uniref:DUF4129 domain-containing protein n=1 Tax=Ancylothrix sp. D3o TaxID=2953691 RepID=UPI0021BA6153|nr:DUF4129 domain-containing protein [Ancylothrix sp. D3o]MCT7950645.1 DUF4129 domain-containing protein [Ancylothrix sp. D3o]
MKTAGFEKSNLGWQFGQVQQQVAEWVELQLSKLNFNGQKQAPPGEWRLDWLEGFLRGMFWVILALLLGWLVWLAWRLWPIGSRRLRDLLNFSQTPAPKPEKPMPTAAEWLTKAAQLRREGDFGLAARCLYLAMLQRLNDSGRVKSQASLTDGEYRQLLRGFSGRQGCEVLLSTHEAQCFGEMPITAEDFERCQEAFGEIEKL